VTLSSSRTMASSPRSRLLPPTPISRYTVSMERRSSWYSPVTVGRPRCGSSRDVSNLPLLTGIWDCLSSQQVVDFIRRALANGDALTKICEDLMVKCLAPDSELGGIGCDNMTVVIVALLNGRTLEEWQEWVKKRVDSKGT
jgi:hypothetical protein